MGDLQVTLAELIPAIAARKRRDAHGAIDVEDLEQEMWLAATEHQEILTQHSEDGNEDAIRAILGRAANRALRAEEREDRAKKALNAGYQTHDEIFYSLGLLRRLLPLFYESGFKELETTT